MTREDIIRMANDVGIKGPATARQGFKMYANPDRLKRFAALVAKHEREACARLCEELLSVVSAGDEHRDGVADCIAAIRARGQA